MRNTTTPTTTLPIPTKLTGIDPKRVVNKEYLNSLGDFYKCSICFNVMVNPTDCEKCGHSYCNECISRLKCPYNCEPKTLKPSSMGIKALLSNLFFYCDNDQCDLKISYSNVQSHDLSCEYQRITCPSTGCNLQLPRKDLERHIKDECQYSLISCKYCGYDFVKSKVKDHEEACSSIYSALNGDGSVDIANMNIDPKKYLQALSLNISKLIKETRTKGKNEDVKEKETMNTNMNMENMITMVEMIIEKRNKSNIMSVSNTDNGINENNGIGGDDNNGNSYGISPGVSSLNSLQITKEIKEEMDKKMVLFEKNLEGLNLTLEEVKKVIIEKSLQEKVISEQRELIANEKALKEKEKDEEENDNTKALKEEALAQKNQLMMATLLEKVLTVTETKLNNTISQLSTDLKTQIKYNETLNTKIDSIQSELTESQNSQKELKEIISQPLSTQTQPQPHQIEIKEIEKVVTVLPSLDFADYFTQIIQLIQETNSNIITYHQQLIKEIQAIGIKIGSMEQAKPSLQIESSSLKRFDDLITYKEEEERGIEIEPKEEEINEHKKDEAQLITDKENNVVKTNVVEETMKVIKSSIKQNNDYISNTFKTEVKEFNENIKTYISTEIEEKIKNINGTIEGMSTEIISLNKKIKEIKVMISEEFEDISQLINDNNKKSEEAGTVLLKTIEDKINQPQLINTIEEEKPAKPSFTLKENSIYHNIEFLINSQQDLNRTQIKVTPQVIETQSKSLTSELTNEITSIIKQTILPALTTQSQFTLTDSSINELKSSIISELDIKLENLETKIEENIDGRLKSMFSLKWCSECEKVDYFYGFIKCSICLNESCKQCVMLCLSCKHLVCKNCASCPKCNKPYCQSCRISCQSCDPPRKYCDNCIQSCSYCKKQICTMCIRQCITCKKSTCIDCSKTCKICEKHSCIKCDTSKNFKTCFKCSQTACKDCIRQCTFCESETCQKCFASCYSCKKMTCTKCSHPCYACEEEYCPNCSKDFSKCGKCNKEFCISCIKSLRRCKKCSKNTCKECCNQCKKCKNIYCTDCSIGCDNCSGYMCSNCTYKCVCDMVVFCEKCLLDINPIGPHDCVLFNNDSSYFKGIKSRSKIKLLIDFEAKFFLEKYTIEANLLIGLTDNNKFDEDSVTFIDNVWAFKIRTGEKYSSFKSLEPFYNKECREGYSILIAKKNDNLFFRVNSDDMPPAYAMAKKDYWMYIENDAPIDTAHVRFVYIRKI